MASEEGSGEVAVRNNEPTTLFVKNLPENTTKEQLELVFAEVGKLRHCFVVKKRRSDEFRGIGFVTFAEAASADAALKRTFKLGSCQLDVSIAEDKKKNKKDPSEKRKPKISFTKEAKKARQLQKAKLIVRNLSFKATQADLEKEFGKHGEVVSVTIPKKDDGKVRGFAFVQFKKVPEAAKAVQALNAKEILGRPVAVDFAVAKKKFEEVRKTKKTKKLTGNEKEDSDDEGPKTKAPLNGKKSKSVREGKSSSDSSDGSDSDSEDVTDSDDEESADEPSNAKHKHLVKKKGHSDAESNESDSEVEFASDGEVRLVKADEVKDKSRVLKKTKPPLMPVSTKGAKRNKSAGSSGEEDETSNEEMDASEGSEDSDDEADDEDEEQSGSEDEDAMEVDEDESESDDVYPADAKNSASKKEKPPKQAKDKAAKSQPKTSKDEDSDSDWGHTPNDDSSEDETEEGREKAKRKREMIKKEDLSRTVFVKNISFDTTQTTFQEHMKKFGPYKFCLLCMDKMLDRSKGTGFVKFEERADAARCVESLQKGEVTLDGKVLSGSIAMKRDQLQEEIQKKVDSKHQPKDKRNLYLAREGFIRGGTSAGAQVSDHDLKIRAKLEANKKKALKNLHNFVSTTRLCIHNLPHTCDDKQLRRIFGRVVDRTAKITEARVMRNMKRLGSDGKAVSKGFGFVNFERHEDALKALRAVNNNPSIFTDQMRPIVSFSIENRAALMVKERRLKRSQEKLQEMKQMKRTGQEASVGNEIDYQTGKRLPFEGLRAQIDMKVLPKRVGEKVRLDPKRRQHQMQLKRLARQAKRKPEFKKRKEKKPRGPTKAQLKERRAEKSLNQMIDYHRQKMRRQVD